MRVGVKNYNLSHCIINIYIYICDKRRGGTAEAAERRKKDEREKRKKRRGRGKRVRSGRSDR